MIYPTDRTAQSRQAIIEQRLRARDKGARNNQRIAPRTGVGPAPLSAGQRRNWILHQMDPSSPVQNRPMALRLRGRLDDAVLERALNEIVRRHEVLRSVVRDDRGEPYQLALPMSPVRLEKHELGQPTERERESEARRVGREEAAKGFDLTTGPLFRPKLLRLSEQDHVLLVLMHHIVFDGWSENVFVREFKHFYHAYSQGQSTALPDLSIQYADFATWQTAHLKDDLIARQIDYWRRQLEDIPAELGLPGDQPSSDAPRHYGERIVVELPAELAEELKQFCRRENISLFMALLAAYQLLLARYAGQDDIVIGVPVAGRTRVETEPLIGCFMNVLVLRTRFEENPTVRELLAQVRNTTLQAFANQDLPFEKLVEELNPERKPDRWPLFNAMFQLRNLPKLDADELEELSIERFDFGFGILGGLDMGLEIKEIPEGLLCSFRYDPERFQPIVQPMIRHFRRLLEAMVSNPDTPVLDLPMLDDAERNRLLVEWNDTAAEFPTDVCLHELFEQQVEKTPDAVALIFEGDTMTYRELNARANRLAHYLRGLGAGPEALVGICIRRSMEMVIGVLGILKTGAAYLPLDPDYPAERLAFIIEDSQTNILLTEQALFDRIPKPANGGTATEVVLLDAETGRWSHESDRNPGRTSSPDNLAYVIYTSGSTGKPKGVMIGHRSACNFLFWRKSYFPLHEKDRQLQRASFSFDDSVWEFFEPLMVGASIVLLKPGGQLDSAYLVDLMVRERVTSACFVPSMLKLLLDESRIGECTPLRRLDTGAEVLPPAVRDQVLEKSNTEFWNGYGPTEATVASIYYPCKRGDRRQPVPIGRPIANTQCYLLDKHRQLVPIGAVGEICIGGAGLARGYWRRPEITAEKFIPSPFGKPGERLYRTGDLGRYLPDGNIEFLGRADNQVKVRGFRIELEEVEEALGTHPSLREVAVAACEDSGGDTMLAAYVVPQPGHSVEAASLRKFLLGKLAEYMVPSVFLTLDQMPRLTSGKINRKALPSPDPQHFEREQDLVALETPTEEALARIWAELLSLPEVGRNDNFFASGGHSLVAARMISEIRETFDVELSMLELFDHPTVGELAVIIEAEAEPENAGPPSSLG